MPRPVMPWFSWVMAFVLVEGYSSVYSMPLGMLRARLSVLRLRSIMTSSASAIACTNFACTAFALGSCKQRTAEHNQGMGVKVSGKCWGTVGGSKVTLHAKQQSGSRSRPSCKNLLLRVKQLDAMETKIRLRAGKRLEEQKVSGGSCNQGG